LPTRVSRSPVQVCVLEFGTMNHIPTRAFSSAPRAEKKARQRAKIKEIGQALVSAGYISLQQQSKALGLSRSSTYAILRASHKGSGLSAATIESMLASRQLPSSVRAKIVEYRNEKIVGLYGHSETQRRAFEKQLALKGSSPVARRSARTDRC
jgi:predicted DNA-binding transcriptional regulator AlpA